MYYILLGIALGLLFYLSDKYFFWLIKYKNAETWHECENFFKLISFNIWFLLNRCNLIPSSGLPIFTTSKVKKHSQEQFSLPGSG